VSAIPRNLLPETAEVGPDGVLQVGGCSLADVAAEFGTPVFVYDETHLRNRCREAIAAFGKDRVVYATKAFLCGGIARLAHEEGLLFDVATGGELFVVLNAGVPADRCVLHGNNKSVEELRYAIESGVRQINVDSFAELDRLEALHAEGLPRVAIQLRVTPGVHAHTHEYIATGQDDSKFGFNLTNGEAAIAAARARASSAVELVGIHCHIGSNVFSVENFGHAVAIMAAFAKTLEVPEVTLGGGLGVAYVEGEEAPSLTQWGKVLLDACAAAGLAAKISVEPGRSIVASAGMTVYTIGTIKDIPGIRRYVAVDGGMSDNPRPVLYGSGYECFLPRRPFADRTERARIVGKHCESGDILIFDGAVPSGIALGDLLATPVTGAYGHAMASNYNKICRPPVVFVRDGKARLVLRRETFQDLVTCEVNA